MTLSVSNRRIHAADQTDAAIDLAVLFELRFPVFKRDHRANGPG